MLKRILFVLFILSAAASAAPWLTSYEEAVRESQRTGKPILMDFTGSDWCIWCKRLKAEVFDTPEFEAWAARKVVLLELDFPRSGDQSDALKKQNAELQEKYNIQGFPSILFVNSKGEVQGEYGYDAGGPSVWTKNADAKLKKK